MKIEVYKEIIYVLDSNKMNESMHFLKLKFPNISEGTLISIYSQYYHNKVKSICHKHLRNAEKYFRQYCSSALNSNSKGFLYRQAVEHNYPPSLYARIILEQFYKHNLKQEVTKSFLSKHMKEPKQISDDILSREVEICNQEDDVYGPTTEKIKHETGLKYEKIVSDFLHEQNIPYAQEETLRKEGYDKTPDFKLILPISINNYVINWIECKALFGTEDSHKSYLENQFWSYTNRFGPGLVIYWFGYIDELNINAERGIILTDHLPKNIITLEKLLDDELENFYLSF
ncbi:CDAN1-interacting nuclease 1 [Hydra vulgaris]|uniref:CDAN1-interacting nuclease 1 n=1 Tax=Hydra vulgaris TaxID=6087 RepID=A0ABM4CJG6_HYDVU